MSPLGKARLGGRNDSANIVILRRISTENGRFTRMTPESWHQRKGHPLQGGKKRCDAPMAQRIKAINRQAFRLKKPPHHASHIRHAARKAPFVVIPRQNPHHAPHNARLVGGKDRRIGRVVEIYRNFGFRIIA